MYRKSIIFVSVEGKTLGWEIRGFVEFYLEEFEEIVWMIYYEIYSS